MRWPQFKRRRRTQRRAMSQSDDSWLPMAVAEAPQAVWYVRPPGGGQYGPADGNVFYQWLTDQRVSPDSLVWRDGWPQWLVAGEALEDFFGTAWRVPADATTEGGAEESSAHTAAPGDITVTDVSKTVTDVVVDPRIDADIRRATTAAIAAQSGATGTVSRQLQCDRLLLFRQRRPRRMSIQTRLRARLPWRARKSSELSTQS